MPSGPGVLAGVDVGTTNCKVGVIAPDGAVLAGRRRPTPPDAPALVAGVLDDLRGCLDGRRPLAVGTTGVAEGGVALDADLRPAGPRFRWHDRRPADAARRLAQRYGRTELFPRGGVDVSAKTPLALWCWHGDLARMRTWAGVADLVATALCGEPLTDWTLAGRTGAFDQRAGRYDDDLLAPPGLRPAQLPEPRGAGAAGHHHLVAAYAAGVREPDDVAGSLGTAETVVTVARTPPPDAAAGTGIAWNRTAEGEHWALVSGSSAAGRLCARCGGGLDTLAETVHQPTGVVVLPHLGGRAAPSLDDGRGLSIRGLPPHDRADLVVVVLEGASRHRRRMAEVQARHAGTELGCRATKRWCGATRPRTGSSCPTFGRRHDRPDRPGPALRRPGHGGDGPAGEPSHDAGRTHHQPGG